MMAQEAERNGYNDEDIEDEDTGDDDSDIGNGIDNQLGEINGQQ